jgi:lipopolysaccharide/colanic/teichoic acid biosynthesis glycosyltransferase
VRRRERRLLLAGLLTVDTLALVLAVGTAGALRLGVDEVLPVAQLGWPERHLVASILVVPVLIVLLWLQGRYDLKNSLIGPREYAQIAHATTYGVIVALGLSYFAGGEPIVSRSWLLLVWILAFVFVAAGRFLARHFVRRMRRRGMFRTRVVIVGASSVGVALAEQFQAAEGEGIDVVGFLDEYLPVGQHLLPGLAVLGRPGQLLSLGRVSDVDEYVLVPQALPHERLEAITRLMIAREGPTLRMAVNSQSLLTHGVLVTNRGSVPLLTMQRARINGLDIVLKRALDVFGASAALIGFLPFVLIVLVAALARGRRPVLESHHILSVGGGTATLHLIAPHDSTSLALRGAPALVAVLRGRLSLVGPRPTRYGESAEGRPLWLTAVKPGLTGPWRLSGPGASREDQALQDLSYVRSYSIWEDLRILWLSVRRLISTGAPEHDLVRWLDDAPGTQPRVSEPQQLTA